jgi:hypothetical protein
VARSDSGREAPRGWCDLLESRCWCGSSAATRTTSARCPRLPLLSSKCGNVAPSFATANHLSVKEHRTPA